MKLVTVLEGAGISCPEAYKKIEISTIVTDSSLAENGSMFIALRGNNTDGHEYIGDAVKNGAVVIVAEQVRDECVGGAAIILVDNTRRAAALLYNSAYGYPSRKIKLIGVTGTNGKTSVSYMLKSIFEAAGIRCGVLGTVGAEISGSDEVIHTSGLTTPEASELYSVLAKMADMGAEYVFMEVSSHAIAKRRIDALEFEMGVFTNLSRDHLDFHGTMENYFITKASFFTRCKRRIVNADDAYGRRLTLLYGGCVTCSAQRVGAYYASEVRFTRDGATYLLNYPNGTEEIELSALGDFSVINSVEAAAAALECNVPISAVKVGLSRFFGAKGRMQRVYSDDFEVIIDYAHTPDALENALISARRLRGGRGRVTVVFGCGGERDRGKRKQMALVASKYAHACVITSDNPRGEDAERIIADVMKGINKEKPYAVIRSRADAIRYAVSSAQSGDVVLIAGKGHEKYQIDADGVHAFDEQELILDALDQRKRKV